MDQKDQMTEKTKRRDKESYNFMDVPPILLWGLGHQLGSPFYPAELEIECQPLRQLSTLPEALPWPDQVDFFYS